MSTKNKVVKTLLAAALMAAPASVAWADCDDDKPDRGAPGATSAKFHTEVRKAKLQVGANSAQCYSKSQIGSSSSKNVHFYTTNDDKVVNFLMANEGWRSELRVEDEDINVEAGGNRSFVGKLRFIGRSDELDTVTFMQIHIDSSDQRGPLAALKWSDNLEDSLTGEKKKGYYLTIRESATCDSSSSGCAMNIFVAEDNGLNDYKKFLLGIYDGQLRLKIDGQQIAFSYENVFNNGATVTNDIDINLNNTYWDDDHDLYFKLGAYMNSDGSAHIQFGKIEFN